MATKEQTPKQCKRCGATRYSHREQRTLTEHEACVVCGFAPPKCYEGCECYHCRRCGSHTLGPCSTCDGCDRWDESLCSADDLRRRYAWETMQDEPSVPAEEILRQYGLA